jgi:hypothetical protein
MEESEGLQDLTSFDFSPEDQKNILSQREDPFSMSTFRRASDAPAASDPQKPNSHPPLPGPAAEGTDNARKGDEIRNFFKDLGVEWKD